jgi:hypothetical protein
LWEQVRVLDIWKDDSQRPDVAFVLADINDHEAVAKAMRGVDYVHHNVALVALAKAGRWSATGGACATARHCWPVLCSRRARPASFRSLRGHPGWTDANLVEPDLRYGLRRDRVALMTIHLFGSCPMGRDPDLFPVDPWGHLAATVFRDRAQ